MYIWNPNFSHVQAIFIIVIYIKILILIHFVFTFIILQIANNLLVCVNISHCFIIIIRFFTGPLIYFRAANDCGYNTCLLIADREIRF